MNHTRKLSTKKLMNLVTAENYIVKRWGTTADVTKIEINGEEIYKLKEFTIDTSRAETLIRKL